MTGEGSAPGKNAENPLLVAVLCTNRTTREVRLCAVTVSTRLSRTLVAVIAVAALAACGGDDEPGG